MSYRRDFWLFDCGFGMVFGFVLVGVFNVKGMVFWLLFLFLGFCGFLYFVLIIVDFIGFLVVYLLFIFLSGEARCLVVVIFFCLGVVICI